MVLFSSGLPSSLFRDDSTSLSAPFIVCTCLQVAEVTADDNPRLVLRKVNFFGLREGLEYRLLLVKTTKQINIQHILNLLLLRIEN